MSYGLYRLSALLGDPSLRQSTQEAMQRFDCGYDATDVTDYLRFRAAEDDAVGRCRTYLIVDLDALLARKPEISIQAYFTITQHSLDVTELLADETMAEAIEYLLGSCAREDHGHTTVPGYLIVQFAKDKSHAQSAKGFLQFAQATIERASSLAGGMYIALDCGSEKLRDYYRDFGFVCVDERRETSGTYVYQMLKLIGQGLDAGFLGVTEV